MARARIKLKQPRKILSLTYESHLSLRDTAQLTGISKTIISEYLVRFRRTRINYQESENLSDNELISLLEEKKQEESVQYATLVSLFPECWRLLKKRGMIKQLLWEKYRKHHPEGYGYSQFCHHFGIFLSSGEVTMRQENTVTLCLFCRIKASDLPVV